MVSHMLNFECLFNHIKTSVVCSNLGMLHVLIKQLQRFVRSYTARFL